MIHIARDRQQLGQFTEDEVAEGLKSGRFLPTDLAWREHMPAWIPLAEFDDLPDPETTSLDMPPPILEVVGEIPASPATLEPAWERSAELGLFAAISRTLAEVLLNPTRTFAAMTQTGGLSSADLLSHPGNHRHGGFTGLPAGDGADQPEQRVSGNEG